MWESRNDSLFQNISIKEEQAITFADPYPLLGEKKEKKKTGSDESHQSCVGQVKRIYFLASPHVMEQITSRQE